MNLLKRIKSDIRNNRKERIFGIRMRTILFSWLVSITSLGIFFVHVLSSHNQIIRESLQTTLNQTMENVVYIGIICIFLSLLASILYAGRLVRPILCLQQAIDRVADGDFSTVENIQTGNEIEGLYEAFNSMSEVIRETQENLIFEKKKADAATQEKSKFLATMSHEIRTPLNGVVGMLRLLKGTPLTTKQQHFVQRGELAAETLLTTINNILDFSKIEAGKLEINIHPFNLREMVDNVVQMFAHQTSEKNIGLSFIIDPDVPLAIMGDSTRITQILANLLSNAVKFTDSGDVSIRVELEGKTDLKEGTVHFKVEDSGIGIRSNELSRIFEPFQQEDGSTTRRFGGTGLGLGICKQLVSLMDGEIGVKSCVGEGSVFEFTLPFSIANVAPKRTTNLHGKRVLIVENNAIQREALCQQLEVWGGVAVEAECGVDALALMHESSAAGTPVNLVIIAWELPDTSGEELGNKIRLSSCFQNVGLFLMGPISEINTRLQESKFSAFLSKPVRQSELYDALVDYMNLDPESADTSAVGAHLSVKGGLKKRVLVVEDNEINQEVAFEILQSSGHTCVLVSNGSEAVEETLLNEYDLVFMDCMMPEMDGYEATQYIRKREQGTQKRVPIIALTASAMDGDRARCLEAGMDDYICKPVVPEEMFKMVKKWSNDKSVACTDQDRLLTISSRIFDYAALRRRCMGNNALVEKLILKFFDQLNNDMESLSLALSQSDIEKIVLIAHRMKGSSVNLSMKGVYKSAERLESLSRKGSYDMLADSFAELRTQVATLKMCISIYSGEQERPLERNA